MTPRIAVVGHPNKGKSSIVATLAEDDAVAIAGLPGTTTRATRYPFTVDGEVLYELIDTPGFQRPRETLEWLEAHLPAAHQRAEAIAQFVDAADADVGAAKPAATSEPAQDRFADERELLRPLVDGAGVLYVVDGSKPYGPEYEAEMQVLRWAGRPRMALINLIGEGNFVDEWRRALDQFFSIVRVFDATRADFGKRLELLRGFAELDEDWRAPMSRAVEALLAERAHRAQQSAVEVAGLLLDAVTRRVTVELHPEDDPEPHKPRLTERLLEEIRAAEQRERDAVQSIYRHAGVSRREQQASLLDSDPFSAESWQVFGLTRTQLATTGAVSGAIAGGGVDLVLGGASLLLGAGVGALLGGVGGFFGTGQLAKAKLAGLPLGGRELVLGPVRDPNLAYVLLGRAVLHQRLVAERNHARREALVVDDLGAQRATELMARDDRQSLNRLLVEARERESGVSADRQRLAELVLPLLAQ